MDVAEASRELGISSDAVRKRIARGSLRSDREDGNVLVWLDEGWTEAGREAQVDGGALVDSLQDQVLYLRAALNEEREARRRADTIIAQLTQANAALASRVPELEAAPQEEEQRRAPESADEGPEGARPGSGPRSGTGGPQEPSERPFTEEEPERRGFWSRLFGG